MCRQNPLLLSVHVTECSIFKYGSIILPRLWASIGVTRSYLSSYAVCVLICSHVHAHSIEPTDQHTFTCSQLLKLNQTYSHKPDPFHSSAPIASSSQEVISAAKHKASGCGTNYEST